MKGLRPFFPYYGSKWRAALHYPEPKYNIIIEPFAGSACYSLRYPDHSVFLVEKDPVIYDIWHFLIWSDDEELEALPEKFENLDELDLCSGAKALIGFWLNHGTTSPSKSPSAWMRAGKHNSSFWGPEIKERIIAQRPRIRSWSISGGTYEKCADMTATWFIDPPYEHMGRHYKHNNIDYGHLSKWCRERKGQVIVCEQEGADWLPFKPFREMKSTKGKSKEVVYVRTVL